MEKQMAEFEFGVHGSEMPESGHLSVIGRCYKGPVKPGLVFTVADPPDGGDAVPVQLEVLRIEAYGHTLDELDEGVTARLFVVGPSVALPDGCVLRGTT